MTGNIWVCDVCGRSDTWGPGWEWYGPKAASWGEAPVEVVTCSEHCRALHITKYPMRRR